MSGLMGFEMGVLRSLPGQSVAIAFGGEGKLGWHLKVLGKRVFTNDLRQAATWQAIGLVENNGFILSASTAEMLLDAANEYLKTGELRNQGLLKWFPKSQACWLEGFRDAVIRLEDRPLQGLALTLGQRLGDYWLSFDEQTQSLRRDMEDIVPELLIEMRLAVDNRQENRATNFDAHHFVIQVQSDVVYARFPSPQPLLKHQKKPWGWSEVWVNERSDVWEVLTFNQRGRFGGHLLTKSKYHDTVRSFLKRLKHFPCWALSTTQPGSLTLDELTSLIDEFRPIDKVFSKDVSDFTNGFTQYIVVTQP